MEYKLLTTGLTFVVFLVLDLIFYAILKEPSIPTYFFQAGWLIAMLVWAKE